MLRCWGIHGISTSMSEQSFFFNFGPIRCYPSKLIVNINLLEHPKVRGNAQFFNIYYCHQCCAKYGHIESKCSEQYRLQWPIICINFVYISCVSWNWVRDIAGVCYLLVAEVVLSSSQLCRLRCRTSCANHAREDLWVHWKTNVVNTVFMTDRRYKFPL